jgi:chaperonin GroEL (HSP60 family)
MCLVYVQDKILQSTGGGQNVTVTNDGATILKSFHIDNPAPKVLIGILLFERTDRSHAKILLILVKHQL